VSCFVTYSGNSELPRWCELADAACDHMPTDDCARSCRRHTTCYAIPPEQRGFCEALSKMSRLSYMWDYMPLRNASDRCPVLKFVAVQHEAAPRWPEQHLFNARHARKLSTPAPWAI
jgi:hypothetical protein